MMSVIIAILAYLVSVERYYVMFNSGLRRYLFPSDGFHMFM